LNPTHAIEVNAMKPPKYHNYYEDQFSSIENKENIVLNNYNNYRKASDDVRKNS